MLHKKLRGVAPRPADGLSAQSAAPLTLGAISLVSTSRLSRSLATAIHCQAR